MKLSKSQLEKHRMNRLLYGTSFIDCVNPNLWQKIVAWFKRENPNYVVLNPTKIRISQIEEIKDYGLPNFKNQTKNV